MGAWCASCSNSNRYNTVEGLRHVAGTAESFVDKMDQFLQLVRDRNKGSEEKKEGGESKNENPPRTQVYTYSLAERTVIMSHLIKVALDKNITEETNPKVRLCLGALCEGTNILLTDFQPKILSDVLLSFLSKRSVLSKRALQLCCARLNLKTEGTVEELRKDIEREQKRLAEIGGRIGDDLNRREVGQLGKIVVLKKEIELVISLPIPGFVDLPQTADVFLEPGKPRSETDDALFGIWQKHPEANGQWLAGLKHRNRCMQHVVSNVRQRIASAGLTERILLNEAKPLALGMMDICESEKLRKLLFMLQVRYSPKTVHHHNTYNLSLLLIRQSLR